MFSTRIWMRSIGEHSPHRKAFRDLISLRIFQLLLLFVMATPAFAQQNAFTMVRGNYDQGVPFPIAKPAQQSQSATALGVIQEYRAAVGTAAWSDMQGTGKISFTASADGTSSKNAILQLVGSRACRLDIAMSNGTRSIRMAASIAGIQDENGRQRNLDSRDSAEGLIVFPELLDPHFISDSTVLADQGKTTVDGVSLYRVSIGTFLSSGLIGKDTSPILTVTDFYFNPDSHLLVKSASAIIGASGASPQRSLRVISYGDYRSVQGVEIPFQYRETINGQIIWTLQLNTVQLNQGISESAFHF